MRRAAFGLSLIYLFTTACGYVGPVQPPSPMVPIAAADLSVREQGDKLYIAFTAPAVTADAQYIKRFSDIELRIGPDTTPFDLSQWESTAQRYILPLPPEADPDDPKAQPMEKQLPASAWEGKSLSVMVRTAVKGENHFSGWSNRVHIDVVKPLAPPAIKVEPTKDGYHLTWVAEREGLHFQVFRRAAGEKTTVPVGTAEKPEYIDSTAQWDTPYNYTVVAQQSPLVESLPSQPQHVNAPDIYPPTAPIDLTALAGPESVEVSWTRNKEADVKGYRVYRSTDNGPFAALGDLTALPTFSDRQVQHGKSYRYSITAVDTKGNESDRSTPVDVAY